jgi:hypothetical protein
VKQANLLDGVRPNDDADADARFSRLADALSRKFKLRHDPDYFDSPSKHVGRISEA